MTASERDLRTLARIVSDHRADLPSAGLPPSLLADLMGQIRCDELQFNGCDTGRHIEWFSQMIPGVDDDSWDDWELYWTLYWDSIPCSYPDRTGDLRSVTKPLDFYSARQWHSTAMYSEFFRPMGMEHEMMLCLPAGYRRTIHLIFLRGSDPDFSERDRALLTLLRPPPAPGLPRRRTPPPPNPQLTPRQRELLNLVAAGHTNSQVARRLGVSEGTVRTHLENIYERLQVSSRTAAVTRAFPDRPAT